MISHGVNRLQEQGGALVQVQLLQSTAASTQVVQGHATGLSFWNICAFLFGRPAFWLACHRRGKGHGAWGSSRVLGNGGPEMAIRHRRGARYLELWLCGWSEGYKWTALKLDRQTDLGWSMRFGDFDQGQDWRRLLHGGRRQVDRDLWWLFFCPTNKNIGELDDTPPDLLIKVGSAGCRP